MRASIYGRQSLGSKKSINEQLDAGHQVIRDEGWTHVEDFQDGTGASRHSRKKRDDWQRVLQSVENDELEVLILWEQSRGDRKPGEWLDFLELCREHNVSLHIVMDDRTYDPRKVNDWKQLAHAGVDAAAETDLLSLRTKRGMAGAAARGLPHGGGTPYGYERTYDPATGVRLGLSIKPDEAAVVRDIFRKVADGVPVSRIVTDLNGLRATQAAQRPWSRVRLRLTVRNRSYVALRVSNGTEYAGQWEPIVDDELFYAAQAVLGEPGRSKTKPGRQKHLLSYLIRCGVCDSPMETALHRGTYRCSSKRHCTSVKMSLADNLISGLVIGRLLQPDAYKHLVNTDDKAARKAHGELAKLKARLDDARMKAATGKLSLDSLAVIEPALVSEIETVEEQARALAVPPVLRDMLSPGVDVRERWEAATVVARRTVIKALCDVRVGVYIPSKTSDHRRFNDSRWIGDEKTWGELWD